VNSRIQSTDTIFCPAKDILAYIKTLSSTMKAEKEVIREPT
jgi:hypothetical protein